MQFLRQEADSLKEELKIARMVVSFLFFIFRRENEIELLF